MRVKLDLTCKYLKTHLLIHSSHKPQGNIVRHHNSISYNGWLLIVTYTQLTLHKNKLWIRAVICNRYNHQLRTYYSKHAQSYSGNSSEQTMVSHFLFFFYYYLKTSFVWLLGSDNIVKTTIFIKDMSVVVSQLWWASTSSTKPTFSHLF